MLTPTSTSNGIPALTEGTNFTVEVLVESKLCNCIVLYYQDLDKNIKQGRTYLARTEGRTYKMYIIVVIIGLYWTGTVAGKVALNPQLLGALTMWHPHHSGISPVHVCVFAVCV